MNRTFAFILNETPKQPGFRKFILAFIEGVRVAEAARGNTVRLMPTLSDDCYGWQIVCDSFTVIFLRDYLAAFGIALKEI